MGLSAVLAKQLRCPRGQLGWYMGYFMRFVNGVPNEWTISRMNILPNAHVLEVGFGPGYAIKKIAAMVPEGRVYGIDFSDAMLKFCSRLNAAEIAAGRVELKCGEITKLPYDNEAFDWVLAVNTLYFLPDPLSHLMEIRRTLKKEGHVAIYFTQKETMNRFATLRTEVFTKYSSESVQKMLGQAGFRDIGFEHKSFRIGRRICGTCVLAAK